MSHKTRKFEEGDLLLLASPDKQSFTPVICMKCDFVADVCEIFDPEQGDIITVYAGRLAWPEHD